MPVTVDSLGSCWFSQTELLGLQDQGLSSPLGQTCGHLHWPQEEAEATFKGHPTRDLGLKDLSSPGLHGPAGFQRGTF